MSNTDGEDTQPEGFQYCPLCDGAGYLSDVEFYSYRANEHDIRQELASLRDENRELRNDIGKLIQTLIVRHNGTSAIIKIVNELENQLRNIGFIVKTHYVKPLKTERSGNKLF